MNDLEELLTTIYIDIRKRNTERSQHAIPQSDEFYDYLTSAYSVIPFAAPKLIKILVDSHKVFSFKIIEADRKAHIRSIEGLVVAEGNIISVLLDQYSDELIRLYSNEFSAKYSIERIIKEFLPKLDQYNNTPLGIVTNMVINLMSIKSILERNIMLYGIKWQEKKLQEEIGKSDPLNFFIDTGADKAKSAGDVQQQASKELQRSTDVAKYEDLKKYLSKNTIEKTLTVYGVEFYSRVCFREYQFSVIRKLVEDEIIYEKMDLMLVKKMLQKTRSHSDQDLNLQKYANEINDLEKLINSKIKKGE